VRKTVGIVLSALMLLAMSIATVGAQDCPVSTVADNAGVEAGQYPFQYELAEFQELGGCTLTFAENPEMTALNSQIAGNQELPPVEERLPAEPLVFQPLNQIGVYGGTLDGLANATESGTSDLLSVRHVNFVAYSSDLLTIVPNIAKGWEWNEDFTELTIMLREGHKWSDGQPFTAADVAFWYNEIILNEDIYGTTPSLWLVSGEPMTVTAVDETTVLFEMPVPAPNYLANFATTYAQPFQPKHFFEAEAEANGLSIAEVADIYYRGSDWKDVPSPLLDGASDKVAPTLEAFILVAENTEGRNLVANPYFHIVDTQGNQLPYINEINEDYIPDAEVRNLRITNGEVDYKSQAVFIENFPLYAENQEGGNYTVDLVPGLGTSVFYSFNTTHKDEGLRAIFSDVRWSQAMSVAIDREEVNEIVYLGQGVPQQSVPAEPSTVAFVAEENLTAFTQYDPEMAMSLLDEMGIVDVDGDGFRERPDGSTLVIQLVFSNQGGPVRLHELTEDYWETVGIQVEAREATSDEYREEGNNNNLDVTTWQNDGTTGPFIVSDTQSLVPPFGDFFNPGTGFEWANWIATDGAEGSEPPADVLRMVELVNEFTQYPLGSERSNEIGAEIVDIHVNNLWKIGIVGSIPVPVVRHNNLGNFPTFTAKSYDYYWAYPYRPAQWFLTE
jgi:peptide/nickel transport system substrate-binding protein